MKLTDEALDNPECRPLGRETGTSTPEWLQELIVGLLNAVGLRANLNLPC